MKLLILGAGGFGTALAVMCSRIGHEVALWSPHRESVERLREERENKRLLPGVQIPLEVYLTDSLAFAEKSQMILLAVPSAAIPEVCQKLSRMPLQQTCTLVSVSKGFEKWTHQRLSCVISECLPGCRPVILSGPSHAEELAKSVPTTVVAASEDHKQSEFVQQALMNPCLRIYLNDDVTGVEIGGALKNVIALCAGICDGLMLGDNTKAALMTRGIAEIARLGVAMGARRETFAGLSGIGDLIVTCMSMHSRNRRAGISIGKGIPPEEAVRQVGTVEGYLAAESADILASRYGVEMPIVHETCQVLFHGKPVQEAIEALMARPGRSESEHVW